MRSFLYTVLKIANLRIYSHPQGQWVKYIEQKLGRCNLVFLNLMILILHSGLDINFKFNDKHSPQLEGHFLLILTLHIMLLYQFWTSVTSAELLNATTEFYFFRLGNDGSGNNPKYGKHTCCLLGLNHSMLFLEHKKIYLSILRWHQQLTQQRRALIAMVLTHHSLDKMAVISQTIFLEPFSWMKYFVFD